MSKSREILDRTDLESVLTSLSGPPVGNGGRARWHCFAGDHDDQKPSVTMFVDRKGIQRWRCWSDGHSGTAIDAVMIGQNLNVADAMRWLEDRAGHTPPAPRQPSVTAAVVPLSDAVRRWVNACEHRLWQPEGENALEWLRRRGLTDDILRANRIGYDPGAHQVPRGRGLPVWRGVTVCSFDRHGELAYAQVRNLDGNAPTKYSNPRQEHGSAPRVTFPRGGSSAGTVIVTEGVMDGLIAAQEQLKVAALISVWSVDNNPESSTVSNEIRAYAGTAPVIIALDGDPAGRAATRRLEQQLAGHPVRILPLADGQDLTTVRKRTKELSWLHNPILQPTPNASSQR